VTEEVDKGVYTFEWKDGTATEIDDADNEQEAMTKTGRTWAEVEEWMWYTSDEYQLNFG